MPPVTNLQKVIALLYYMTPGEVDALAVDILDQRKTIWLAELRNLAAKHGCRNASPNAARKNDLSELRSMSNEDAKSIAATWKADVDREIARLFAANPRGNRYYYTKNMQAWALARARWKSIQIANYTQQSTAFYAANRFRVENGLRGQKYVYEGPPPVSKGCIQRTAAGVVNEAYVQTHPTPNHVNCPHIWQPLNPARLDCEDIWLG